MRETNLLYGELQRIHIKAPLEAGTQLPTPSVWGNAWGLASRAQWRTLAEGSTAQQPGPRFTSPIDCWSGTRTQVGRDE